VCSGVEAATVAWHSLGWEAEAFSEIEKFPSKVLAHHYSHVPNLGDMTKFEEWNIGSIDLLVGGTPCQSFSVAGLRKGLSDPRGNLMLTFGAIANRFRPRWLVWENVPGVLSSNGGRDFGTFLGMLVELGYGWSYRVLDAQYFGVAQRRRRVFVVGYLGDFKRAAAVLFERHSLSGNPPPSRKKGQSTSFGAKSHSTECSHWDGNYPHSTLNQSTKGSGGVGFSNQELFSQRGAYLAPQPVYSMITANTGANGLGVSKEIAPTLDRAQPAAIAQPIAFNARQDPDSWEEHTGPLDTDGSTQAVTHSVVGPLFCHLGTINNQAVEAGHVVHDTIAIPISTQNALGRVNGIDEWPLGIFNDGDPAPTLSKSHGHAVGTNKSSNFAVRRLTPIECERLQGFPDNYTNIPNAADGPRYKALGNSMAVPVMHWIGKRIQQVEDIVNKDEVT
jgi:DNA (cytosine-5)-methyltransferase 1